MIPINKGDDLDFIILEDEDLELVWGTINDLQMIFHPRISKDGKINFKELMKYRNEKQINIILDRNILSRLIKLINVGFLNDKFEMRKLGLLLVWINMNHIKIIPSLAIMEHANKICDEEQAQFELSELKKYVDYHSILWMLLAKGEINEIPTYNLPPLELDNSISYSEDDDHLLMHLAAMIHIVFLFRKVNLSPYEKMMSFLKWYYEKLIISESVIIYATMLFTNQKGIKLPKNSNCNDLDRIIEGCRNQAWDLNYLSNWSCFHYDEANSDQIFLFATNDNMLKYIIINTFGYNGIYGLINEVFTKKESQIILDFFDNNQGVKRIKPDFGLNSREYFNSLIEKEKQRLIKIVSSQV